MTTWELQANTPRRAGSSVGEASSAFPPPPQCQRGGEEGSCSGESGERAGRNLCGAPGWLTWRGVASVLRAVPAASLRSTHRTPPSSRVRPTLLWEPTSLGPHSHLDRLLVPARLQPLPQTSPPRGPKLLAGPLTPSALRPHTWSSASRRHRHPDSRAGTAAAILEAGADGAGRRVTGRGLRWRRRDAGSESRAAGGGVSRPGAGPRVTGGAWDRPDAEPERCAAGQSSEEAR